MSHPQNPLLKGPNQGEGERDGGLETGDQSGAFAIASPLREISHMDDIISTSVVQFASSVAVYLLFQFLANSS